MKKSLVPTDFSPVADNALEYAIEMAAHFKSEICLYHVYSFDKIDYDLAFPKDEQPYTKQLQLKMERTKRKFDKKIKEKGISVRAFVAEDSFYSLFKTRAIAQGADIIVMGSKGASGLTRLIFGSVAATALEISDIPVLVVPPEYRFCRFENIVLAADQKAVSPETLAPLQKLALEYGAQVTVLNVKPNAKKAAAGMPPLSLQGVETAYREVAMSGSISESINQFIQEEGCNLLCMVRRKKSFLESLFKTRITKAQVYNNKVPLLVLPETQAAT